jgi:prepilin-type N-terminal cleavage/methylation domain-containing protein
LYLLAVCEGIEIAPVAGMPGIRLHGRRRPGFSLIELLVVLVVGSIGAALAVPGISNTIAQTRTHRAATVIAADLQLAHSLAARQRMPVRVRIDTNTRVLRLVDYSDATKIYTERHFGTSGEYPVGSMATTAADFIVYPSGLSSAAATVTLKTSKYTRKVTMTRVGQVRVTES